MPEKAMLYKLVKNINDDESRLEELKNNQLRFNSPDNKDLSIIKNDLNINGVVYTTSTNKIHSQLQTVDQFHVYNNKLFVDSLQEKAATLFEKNHEINNLLNKIYSGLCITLNHHLNGLELPIEIQIPSPILNIISEYAVYYLSRSEAMSALLSELDGFIKLNGTLNDKISETANLLKKLLGSAGKNNIVEIMNLAKTLDTNPTKKRKSEIYALRFFVDDAVKLLESDLSKFKLSR